MLHLKGIGFVTEWRWRETRDARQGDNTLALLLKLEPLAFLATFFCWYPCFPMKEACDQFDYFYLARAETNAR